MQRADGVKDAVGFLGRWGLIFVIGRGLGLSLLSSCRFTGSLSNSSLTGRWLRGWGLGGLAIEDRLGAGLRFVPGWCSLFCLTTLLFLWLFELDAIGPFGSFVDPAFDKFDLIGFERILLIRRRHQFFRVFADQNRVHLAFLGLPGNDVVHRSLPIIDPEVFFFLRAVTFEAVLFKDRLDLFDEIDRFGSCRFLGIEQRRGQPAGKNQGRKQDETPIAAVWKRAFSIH